MAVEGDLQPDDKVVIDGTDRLREGAKVEVIASDPRQRAGANAPAGERPHRQHAAPGAAPGMAPGAGTAASIASAPREAAAADRPLWMDRVSPQQADKLQAMGPDERRAWFKEQRAMRDLNPTR
jgi:multidrug efflux system membrane fusion protein